MAEVSLKNGTTGDIAKVDKNFRVHTATIQESQTDHASDSGIEQKYNINTGDITLTNATLTSVLYLKNTGLNDIVVTALVYNLGASTSGSGDGKITVVRNPDAGDIISNTNNVETGAGAESNSNFKSTNIMTGLFYKGATGETALSGGQGAYLNTRLPSPLGRIVIQLGAIHIPTGSSMGINYTPQTSNSSQICQFAVACYVKTALVSAD